MNQGGRGGSRHWHARRLGQDPSDQVIRELIQTGRQATPRELRDIVARIGSAPFSLQTSSMPEEARGITYLGQRLETRASSLLVHLVRRVLVDGQWAEGTDEHEYVSDLRSAVGDSSARIVVYERQGGSIAGILAPNAVPAERRGPRALPWIYVVYSADRGTIVSGYQASGLQEIDIPASAVWLN